MSDFYVIHFRKKQRKRMVLIIIALFLFIILIGNKMSHLLFSKSTHTALIKGSDTEKNIALTFNISWGEEKVYDILNVLKKHQVRATFFVSGEWAERHPQIINQITEQKHELGMLGYRYKNYLEQDLNQVRKDMIYAREVFKKIGYKDLRYIRPPSGLFNEEIVALAEELGLEVVHWSINTNDWKNHGVESIVTVAKNATNGDILLFHASDVAKQTANALKTVLPHYEKENFQFVTISQLKDGVTSDEKLIE